MIDGDEGDSDGLHAMIVRDDHEDQVYSSIERHRQASSIPAHDAHVVR